jgi:wobble nucleotide-excising tRNase
MLKKISKLKHFGVFKDFNWAKIPEFKQKNLIYGWNYSGKTSLSRFCSMLNSSTGNEFYKNLEFLVEYAMYGQLFTKNEKDVGISGLRIKVFNTDYIRNVFTWDKPDSDIDPITFYLGEPSESLVKKYRNFEHKNYQLINIKKIVTKKL